MEGVAPLSLPGIFAVNPPALAELPGRKSGRRSGEGHHPLLATELRLTTGPCSVCRSSVVEGSDIPRTDRRPVTRPTNPCGQLEAMRRVTQGRRGISDPCTGKALSPSAQAAEDSAQAP